MTGIDDIDLEHIMGTSFKDIKCPKCKKVITLKVLLMSSDLINQIKYKVECTSCGKKFETGWRKYEVQSYEQPRGVS